MSPEKDESKELDNEAVIERAKTRFRLAQEYWSPIYKLAEDDLKFRTGEQWPADIKGRRDQDGKPSLTINKVGPAVRQVTNEQRQNRPSLKFSPVDDMADIETAKIRQGLSRHIERRSNADAAFDTAFESAATGGIGFLRLVTEYCDPVSFDQEILIKRVPNFLSALLDPSFQEPDGSDAIFGFISHKMSKDEYQAEYPDSDLAKDDIWKNNSDSDWIEAEECRICEYYEKTFEPETLYLLSDGTTLLEDELAELKAELGQLPPGIHVVNTRKTVLPKITWYKLNGCEVLESTEIPGQYIPIVPVLGDEYYIDGKRVLSGIVRPAMDPQRMYNYWASSETETIALAPRAPFIGVEGQFEGHEARWATANIQSHAYLEYKAKDINGTPVGPPQRNVYEPPVQAITQARRLASDDLKATTGIYDASLGAKSNETSGVAIQRRNVQAQTSNFHLIDNLMRSIRHVGVIINSWIPVYYDGPRVGRIIGEEGEDEIVKLNEEFKHKGQMVTYRMDVGKYDVAVETGPSFATKRQEAAAAMLDLTKSYPNLFPIIGDLMVKNLDIPGAPEMAERLKKVAPPGVIEDKDKKPIPPEVQAQMQQQGQMIEQMTEQLHKLSEELEQKTRELESKERIEFKKMQIDLQKTLAMLDQKDSALMFQTQVGQIHKQQQSNVAGMQAQIAELQQQLNAVHFGQPIDQEQPFENEMASGGPEAPVMPQEQQQPTGGFSPGNNMGVGAHE